MLSAVDIIALEKKVFKYRLKQKIHYLIIGGSFVIVGAVGYYFYPAVLHFQNSANQVSNIQTVAKVSELTENNLTTLIQQTPVIHEVNNSQKYIPDLVHGEQENQTLFLQLPVINKNNTEKKAFYEPEITEKKSNMGIQEEELDNKILMRKMPSIDDENLYRSKEDKIDTALLPPPLLDEPKQKGVIKIETHEVNSIQYLKEKFEKTHNITFALMLAEEYYTMKNYSECNKWALMANNVDPDSEKSWVWFAKSKVKLGHKEDAVLALQAYLKNNKSKAAQSLLNQISVGEVID